MRLYLLVCCLISRAAAGQVEYAIAEETERGAAVGNVARDLGLEAATLPSRRCRLLGGPGPAYLSLEAATGALTVGEPVDREAICAQQPSCALAYELVLENPLDLHKLRLRILDVNDHAPAFPLLEYRLSVAEFLAPGARFALPSARDPDEGSHAVEAYSLSADEHFSVALQTRADGSAFPELVLEKALDREQQATHRLTLTARDGGSPARSGSASLLVTVLDTNDNAPVFERSVYRASVLETSPAGTPVIQVRASDPDEGANGEVRYAFSNSTPPELRRLFAVDAGSGEVLVRGALDSLRPPLELFVEACDAGAFGLSSVAKVLVDITDVNNHAPEIAVTSLSSPLPEDSPLGTVVALLSVTDRDPGENGRVICQLPPQLPFQLRSSFDGYYTLVTSGLLDRERVSEYSVTVTASDLGSPPLASRHTLHLQIADVNDNPPRFVSQRREVTVPENNRPGASLFRVSASDPDLGDNGRVSYALRDAEVQGSALSSFVGVDAEAGTVYARGSFDFERLQSFHFQVEAHDHGSPALAAAFLVSVTVVDENDNAPVFLYPAAGRNGSLAVEVVPRLADAGHLVTKVVAHDADSGQNAWLSFGLLGASDAAGLFRVAPDSGEVRTARSLRSSDALRHKLVVLVTDRGEPPLSASLTLGVLLADALPQALPDFDVGPGAPQPQPLSRLNFALCVSLGCLSCVFLGLLLGLLARRLLRCPAGPAACCAARDEYEKYRYNVRMLPGSHFTPEMVEIAGMGKLTHTYLYRAALGVGPSNNNLGVPKGDAAAKGAALLQMPTPCIQVQKVKSDHFNAILVVSWF